VISLQILGEVSEPVSGRSLSPGRDSSSEGGGAGSRGAIGVRPATLTPPEDRSMKPFPKNNVRGHQTRDTFDSGSNPKGMRDCETAVGAEESSLFAPPSGAGRIFPPRWYFIPSLNPLNCTSVPFISRFDRSAHRRSVFILCIMYGFVPCGSTVR